MIWEELTDYKKAAPLPPQVWACDCRGSVYIIIPVNGICTLCHHYAFRTAENEARKSSIKRVLRADKKTMAGRAKINDEIIQKVVALRAKGGTIKEIAKELGIGTTSVTKYIRN